MTGPGDGGDPSNPGAAAIHAHMGGVFTANAFQVVI